MTTIEASHEPVLTDRELERIASLVYARAGITLHAGKRELVIARLQKRLRTLGLSSFDAYLRHVEADRSGAELTTLLDSIATNHTYFFREDQHFRYLVSDITANRPTGQTLRIWSAACSTGEEPYSIVMALHDAHPSMPTRLLASDLSTKALRAATAGVYKLSAVETLATPLLRSYFERGMGEQAGLARVTNAVRQRIEFRRLNLLEIGDLGERFDVIFCRNVMIYFDQAVQQRVVTMLERHLAPGGHLFISHSESLNGVQHGLAWTAPAVYRRPA
jgi:chemotaxis protein methyltransferase CheR